MGVEEDIATFQEMEKRLQSTMMQKYQFQLQLNEINLAMDELKEYEGKSVFKMVGPVMIEKDKEKALEELESTKKFVEAKLKVLHEDEEKMKSTLQRLYKKIEEGMHGAEQGKGGTN
ncbi:MAG: prefoldin subunit [Candidatus Anstonellales archaeon]